MNGKPATGLAIRQATGANALDVAECRQSKIGRNEPFFPRRD